MSYCELENRPYLNETEKNKVFSYVKNFDKANKPKLQHVKTAKQKNSLNKINHKDYSKKDFFTIVICFFIILITISSSLVIKAEFNKKNIQLNNLEKQNSTISTQIENEKNEILNDIDGHNYIDYIYNVLGMRKIQNNQTVIISNQEDKHENEKKEN